MLELLLGQIPEAIYFALFMIFTKELKTKRILYTILMIVEYVLLKFFIEYNIWFQVAYTIIQFLILKLLYKEKAQVTDIFTFGIASLILITCSIISGGVYLLNPITGIIFSRLLPFIIIFIFKNKLCNIQKLYKRYWNRNDELKTKIKSTTFRCLNVVLFNLMFYIINAGMICALWIRK